MKMDDLKKSWNALGEQLQGKELVTEDELLQVMSRKKSDAISTLSSINRSNKGIVAMTLVLLIAVIAVKVYDSDFLSETLFRGVIAIIPPALAWSIYAMRYLSKIKIEEMPLATVVERVNKYNLWMVIERIAGSVILLAFILISVGESPANRFVVAAVWLLGAVFYYWFVHRYIFRKLKNIRKNLDELRELKAKD